MINLLLALVVVLLPCMAQPTIDGILTPGEWDEAVEVSTVYVAGNPEKPMIGTLYGGWRVKFFGLLKAENGAKIISCDPDSEYWISIDGVKSLLLDRKFVNDLDCKADAMEFSVEMDSGPHDIQTHTNFWFDGEPQTGSFPLIEVDTGCPTAVNGPLESAVVLFRGKSILIVEWSAPHLPPFMTVYGIDANAQVLYKGEAACYLLTCVFVDHYPSIAYFVEEKGERFGPIYPVVLPIPETPWVDNQGGP